MILLTIKSPIGFIVDEIVPVQSNNVHESPYIHQVAHIGENARLAVSIFPVTMNVFVSPPLTRKIGSYAIPRAIAPFKSNIFVGVSEAF
jgi:hypothetical protein